MIIGQGYSRPDGDVGEDHFRRFPLHQAIGGYNIVDAFDGHAVLVSPGPGDRRRAKCMAGRRTAGQRPITGQTFTRALAGNGIAISMDGKGAWRDKVFVERLWRRVKYEEVSARLRQRQRSPCFNRPVF